MGIFHKFVTNKADGFPPTNVQPSDWNAAHVHPWHLIWQLEARGIEPIEWFLPEIRLEYGGDAITLPSYYGQGDNVLSYPLFTHRTKYDFTYCTRIRTVYDGVTTAANQPVNQGSFQLEYSETGARNTWLPLGNPPPLNLVGVQMVEEILPASAKKDVWIRLVGFGGSYARGIILTFKQVSLYTN
jgi:hypothetical protein